MIASSDGGVGDDVGSDADVSTGTTFAFKGPSEKAGQRWTLQLLSCGLSLSHYKSDGPLVTLAFVRQEGLYPPVEAVPLGPMGLFALPVGMT